MTNADVTLSRRTLFIGAGAVAVVAGVAVLLPRLQGTPSELRGLGEGADDVVLINHRGERVRWGDLAGAPRVLFFGFTHCPVICPVTIYELTAALDRLGAAASDVAIEFVTVDPVRDTAERLSEYLSGFGARVTGFTGDADSIDALRAAFQVDAVRTELEGGDYTMDHTATVFLLDRMGRVADLLAFGSPADLIDERLTALAA
jgi:protein SCO1/2